ncbi:MAG: HAD-IB family hydrolase [Chloroflexi bacterium]|nr:HAD-IB family hydrolase [Chloroflexota bacterium]
MQRIVFFDVEGTLVSNNTWRTLIKHPQLGRWRVRRAFVEGTLWWLLGRARVIDDTRFRHLWVMAMARLFAGWDTARIRALFTWVANNVDYRQDVVERLKQHKRDGDQVVLVSGVFDEGVKAFAKHLGADEGLGTGLAYVNGLCVGRISGASCAGERKLDFIQAYLRANGGAELSESYAYADSYSDAAMLGAVGHPVATYPEDELRALALKRGWTVLGG